MYSESLLNTWRFSGIIEVDTEIGRKRMDSLAYGAIIIDHPLKNKWKQKIKAILNHTENQLQED